MGTSDPLRAFVIDFAYGRGPHKIIAEPIRQTAAPIISQRSGRIRSIIIRQKSETALQMPQYAANALPAYAASILVRHKAKRTRHGIPATAHHPLRSKRSHAQNAKHPAISKIAARIYMPVVLKSVVTDCAMTARCFRYAEIRSL